MTQDKAQHLNTLALAYEHTEQIFNHLIRDKDSSITLTIEQARDELSLARGWRSGKLNLIQGIPASESQDVLIYTIDLLLCLRRNITSIDEKSLTRSCIVRDELDKFYTEVDDLINRIDEDEIDNIEFRAVTDNSLSYENKIRRIAKSFLTHDSESMLTILIYIAMKERVSTK